MPWIPITQNNYEEILHGSYERSVCDFKTEYDLTQQKTPYEMAKDIASFANALGGTIIVGAIEGKGKDKGSLVAFKDIDIGLLISKIKRACELCRPIPITHEEIIVLSPDTQNRTHGRSANGDVTIVAINIKPMLATPVGCLVCDENGTKIADAYKFPIRRAEGTILLRPEQISLNMNHHERRMFLQLHELSNTNVTVWSDKRDGSVLPRRHCAITEINDNHWTVTFSLTDEEISAEVPLTFVRVVWRSSTGWNVAIEGSLFDMDGRGGHSAFIPPGGLR